MKRLLALLAAVLVAAALMRRLVPAYAASDYAASDDEGDALEPDVYLIALIAAGQDDA